MSKLEGYFNRSEEEHKHLPEMSRAEKSREMEISREREKEDVECTREWILGAAVESRVYVVDQQIRRSDVEDVDVDRAVDSRQILAGMAL